jgi:hypothetical protein
MASSGTFDGDRGAERESALARRRAEQLRQVQLWLAAEAAVGARADVPSSACVSKFPSADLAVEIGPFETTPAAAEKATTRFATRINCSDAASFRHPTLARTIPSEPADSRGSTPGASTAFHFIIHSLR